MKFSPDSRHFLYFSVCLVLPYFETVQFVPPPSDVGKPRSSVLMFHKAIYQGFIVRFTPLEEVFPASFVTMQSPNFPLTLSLCSPTPTCELWSPPFIRVVLLGHIAIWCSTSRLYNSTGASPRSTLVGILQSVSFRSQ